MEEKTNDNSIFIIDIAKKEENAQVYLTGYTMDKRDYNNGSYGIKVRDITGNVWCNTTHKEIYDSIKNHNNSQENKRVTIAGTIVTNSRGNKVINIDTLNVIDTRTTEGAPLLDSEMKELYANMLMTKIVKTTSTFLQKQGFAEFESKLISRHFPEDNSLEPLLVKFSGFGTPALLSISPAAQIIEFLETTLRNCFTISTSFTQSYRLPNAPSELKIVMAKSLNLDENEHKKLMKDIVQKNLSEITTNTQIGQDIKEYTGDWVDKTIGHKQYFEQILDNDINLICFDSEIPVVGKHYNTVVKKIYHVLDKEKNILMEGARECISDESIISTIVFYPSQFLTLFKNAPARQIKNLDKLFYGTTR